MSISLADESHAIRPYAKGYQRMIMMSKNRLHSPRLTRLLALLGASCLGCICNAQATTRSAQQEQRRIIASVETVFRAIDANEPSLLTSVTEPNFYLFDAGAKFDSASILALLQQMKASGKHFEWHVTEPDVHIHGATAWIAYVDRGKISDSKVATDMVWLESAFLLRHGKQWKVAFMQSTPAANAVTP